MRAVRSAYGADEAMKFEAKNLYFQNLDGLRTVACLMVFFWHALQIGHNSLGISNPFILNLLHVFSSGRNGVSIFFVLSGFLITYLIIREEKNTDKFDLLNFYVRRIFRIWPLYILVLLVIFVLLPVLNHFVTFTEADSDVRPIWYFTFLSNFDVLRIYEMNGVDFLPSTITWSVAIEEQFYLFWPLFFLSLPLKRIQYFLVTSVLVGLVFRVTHHDHPFQLYFHTLSATFDLSIGGLTAWFCFFRPGVRFFFAKLATPVRICFLLVGFCVMYLSISVENSMVSTLMTCLQTIFFALIICDQCLSNTATLKFSNNKWLTHTGKYTYGIYMLHPFVIIGLNTLCIRLFNWEGHQLSTLITISIIGLPITILISKLSYILIESRFLQLKEKFTEKRGLISKQLAIIKQQKGV